MKTIKTPAGMSGLAVEPWSKGEIYAVAANWSQASAPVMVYGEDGWTTDEHGRQVADFRHDARSALESVVREAMAASGAWQEIDEDHVRDEANECEHGVYTGAGECCRCELEAILDDAEEIDSVVTYRVADSNSGDDGLTFAEAVERIGEWFEFLADEDRIDSDALAAAVESVTAPADGDVRDLQSYADDICDAVARAMGSEDFFGHGNYSVSAASAASAAGMRLEVEAE